MATSGSADFLVNTRDLCAYALRKIRVTGIGTDPSAEDAETARVELNMLLKSLQNTAPSLFRQTFGSATLVADTASYVLDPRPFRINEARYRDASGRDLPMREMTRQEYVDLVLKASTGTPTSYYVDYQRDAVTLYVWPVPATATTETVQYTYQRRFEDSDTLDNDIDIPQENLETVGYQLADRLLDTYGKDAPQITMRARMLIAALMDADREAFVRFVPEMR